MKNLLLSTLVFLFISQSFAQEDDKNIQDLYIDLSPPDVSAFTFLTKKPENIFDHGTVRELTAQLINFYDANKKTINPGYGLDWAPILTFNPNWYKKYEKNSVNRMLTKWQLSAGTINDSNGVNVALSTTFQIVNNTDPANVENVFKQIDNYNLIVVKEQQIMIDYKELIDDMMEFAQSLNLNPSRDKLKTEIYPRVENTETNSQVWANKYIDYLKSLNPSISTLNNDVKSYADRYIVIIKNLKSNTEMLQKNAKNYLDSFPIKNWNKLKISVGFGWLSISENGSTKSLQSKKGAAFFNTSLPISSWGQFTFQYAYSFLTGKESNNSLGGRILCGSNAVRGYVEALYARQNSAENNENLKTTLGLEFKVGDMWLALAAGIDKPFEDYSKPNLLSLFDIKYAFNKEKREFK